MLIYLVTNQLNKKQYVGKTMNSLSKRKSNHYVSTKRGSETNFHRALRKYSEGTFKWEILTECRDDNELNKKEMYYIKQYDTYSKGYNMSIGGTGGLTYNKDTANYHRIKHKLGKWKDGNPGSTPTAIKNRRMTIADKDCKVDSILKTNSNVIVQPNRKKVNVHGVEFDSMTEAAKVYGVTIRTVKNRCNNEMFKEWKIDE